MNMLSEPKIAQRPSLFRRIARRLDRIRHPEARLSFAQEAEDLVLLRHLKLPTDRRAFYVDVGAHDPKWYSNTCLLYQSGWTGINIDASPGVAQRFIRSRPRDISLEVAIGTGEEVEFVDFVGHAISGVNNETQARRVQAGFEVSSQRKLQSRTLEDVLQTNLRHGQPIDLLTVDVEGHELSVLRSNDWVRFRPRVVMAEIGMAVSFAEVGNSEVCLFLEQHHYVPYAKTGLTVFFADKRLLRRTALGFEINL